MKQAGITGCRKYTLCFLVNPVNDLLGTGNIIVFHVAKGISCSVLQLLHSIFRQHKDLPGHDFRLFPAGGRDGLAYIVGNRGNAYTAQDHYQRQYTGNHFSALASMPSAAKQQTSDCNRQTGKHRPNRNEIGYGQHIQANHCLHCQQFRTDQQAKQEAPKYIFLHFI